MNSKSTLVGISICAALLLIGAEDASAQAAKAVGRSAKYAPELVLIVAALFGKLAGIGAVIGSGLFARGKPDDAKGIAYLVAAVGGIWTAYNWFGWPFREVFHQGSYWLGTAPSVSSEFSFMRLIGCAILAVIAFVVCAAISEKSDKSDT